MNAQEIPANPHQLTAPDSVTRIADILETLCNPLLAWLQEAGMSPTPENHGYSLEDILANSPIASLLQDDAINDILINGPSEVYVGTVDGLQKTDIKFPDKKALKKLATAIVESVGRTIDPGRPLVDARLKDGSRVNIIMPPMAVDGITISIRKFAKQEITLDTLIEKGEMTAQVAEFLKICAESRVSLLISGGTGTGKTTLLNAISRFIPENERIITIEDTAELRLQQPHVIRLETKEPSVIGARHEEVNTSDLLRNTLRMRPDRIIVGEVRGVEAYDMIQAMNTGHDGSMATVHANTPRDAFTRIENLLGPRMQNTNNESIRRQIISALNLIIQLVYHENGTRMVSSITEIVGIESGIPTMQDIFVLKESRDAEGKAKYRQEWTKIIPRHPRLSKIMHENKMFIVSPQE